MTFNNKYEINHNAECFRTDWFKTVGLPILINTFYIIPCYQLFSSTITWTIEKTEPCFIVSLICNACCRCFCPLNNKWQWQFNNVTYVFLFLWLQLYLVMWKDQSEHGAGHHWTSGQVLRWGVSDTLRPFQCASRAAPSGELHPADPTKVLFGSQDWAKGSFETKPGHRVQKDLREDIWHNENLRGADSWRGTQWTWTPCK